MSNAGNAEPQLGPTHRGWYSRGYLPHCDHPGLLQSITYHLADSLPAAILEQIAADLRTLPPQRQDSERRRRVEAWLDAGHGSCVLRLPEAAACVVDTWRHFAGERYDLIAWVVMPNHVHVLVRVYEGVPLAKIVQSWKSYTGRRIRALMGEERGGGRRIPPITEEESRAGARRSPWRSRTKAYGCGSIGIVTSAMSGTFRWLWITSIRIRSRRDWSARPRIGHGAVPESLPSWGSAILGQRILETPSANSATSASKSQRIGNDLV